MSENPYLSPQTHLTSAAPTTRRVRLTTGGVVFVTLGSILLGLGLFAIFSVHRETKLAFNDRCLITGGALMLVLLGGLLVAHGLVRKETTERWMVLVLGGVVLIGIVVSLLTSL